MAATPANDQPRTAPFPAGLVGGRYRLLESLDEGPAVITCLGSDPASGKTVVVKRIDLLALSPGARMRAEHEAHVLQRLASPCLAPVVDLLRDKQSLYLVMACVPGRSLESRLRDGPLNVRESLAVARSLLAALAELHRHRLLHREVRTANVMIPDEGPLDRAVLVDFGLASGAQPALAQRQEPGRAALYLSPEQAGSLDCDVGESSDLYSVGIVLFECLAGRPPFTGDSLGEVLLQHVTARVPDLRSLGAAVPRGLNELVQRLLRKDPRDRYQSAEAVLVDLEAISAALERGLAEPALVVGSYDRRQTLTEPALVGREVELRQLEERLARARAGQPSLVVVETESGGGKTRLLDEAAQLAARQGFWVLRGQGAREVALKPFQLLDRVIGALVTEAQVDRALAARLGARLGESRDALVAAIPELAKALGCPTSHLPGPEAFGEARSVQALSQLIDALGMLERPTLIILDDCQWADSLTVKLIERWQKRDGEQASPARLLLVVAFRTEEVGADHPLRSCRPAAHLRLAPFQPDDVRQLLESMAGPLPAEAIDVVARLSEGSPFMASALLRGLVESGALVAEQNGWRIEPLAMANLQSSSQAAAVLSRRIELLPRQTLDLLSVAAILGKEFDLDVAAQLALHSPAQAIAALDEARRRRLVWVRPDGSRYVFVHDKIVAALLERLSLPERKDLHHRAALYLQDHAPRRVFDLAYHFDAAGRSEQALVYALEAAEQARSQHALEIAEQQYRIAERGAPSADLATRFRIARGLGDVLMLRGRYDAAARLFETAALLAEGKLSQAQIKGKLGELAMKRGDMETATQAFEQALRLLDRLVPRRGAAFAALLVWEIVVQVLHTLFPRLLVGRRRHPPPEAELLGFRLFSRLAHGYWFVRGKLPVLWAHLRGMNLAERYPPTLELAQAYSEHAPAMSLVPLYRRGIAYARKSLEIRRSFGDLWGQGQSLHYYGVVLYGASRYAECVEKCREAVRLLERTGDYWEVHVARYHIAAALYRMGDLRSAVEESRRNYQSGIELGDVQASGIILDVWSRATEGAVPEELLGRELERKRHDAQGTAQVRLADGVRLMRAGEFERAAEMFESAIEVAERAGICNTYTVVNLAWLATARRAQAAAQVGLTPQHNRALVRQAAAAARRAVRATRRFQNDLPHALREYGLAEAMRGRTRHARRLLDRSLAISQRQGAWYEHATTLLARGRLGLELGWAEAASQVAAGEASLRELAFPGDAGAQEAEHEPASLSLADRFDTLLDAGRKIASALSAPAIYAAARDAALRLLRGERCLVFELGDPRGPARLVPLDPQADHAVDPVSIARALEMGRAVAFVEEVPAGEGQAEVFSGQRSCLCVPIFVRGRPAACLYVAHERVRDLFGADEERLADFIATIAGAALENAEGFQQLQRLNETLEVRVAERTAAAEARARELAQSNDELARVAAELKATEEQLRVAMQAAEAANRAKSQFLATMSHEIRTPLTGVLGFTEMLLTGADDGDPALRSEYLQAIQTSGKHLLALINDILDLSKIEAGQMDFELLDCSPRTLVGDVLRVLGSKAAEKGISLELVYASPLPRTIRTDPARFRQLLMNLVGNAIKFTERGGVRVVVSLTEAAGRPQLAVEVIDSGVGILPEQLDRIFDPFVQADNSITRRFGGSGLGLTISQRLARGLGGGIRVQSTPGVGSTFLVTVDTGPVGRLHPVEDEPAEQPCAPPPPLDLPRLSGARILLVEDGSVNRKLIRMLLQRAGALVATAENGQLGVERALQESFDLVLMDMQMPVKDGYTAARELRARGLDLPIIALTAHAMKGDEEKCRAAGCSGYLTKPIDTAALLSTVAAALPEVRREPCDATPSDAPPAPLVSGLPADDPEFQEIVDEFVEQLDKQLDAMQEACAAGDFSQVSRLAHWLKGTGGNAGFPQLSDLARQLEQASKDEELGEVAGSVRELMELADRIAVPWR